MSIFLIGLNGCGFTFVVLRRADREKQARASPFPQIRHVLGVAVLRGKDRNSTAFAVGNKFGEIKLWNKKGKKQLRRCAF